MKDGVDQENSVDDLLATIRAIVVMREGKSNNNEEEKGRESLNNVSDEISLPVARKCLLMLCKTDARVLRKLAQEEDLCENAHHLVGLLAETVDFRHKPYRVLPFEDNVSKTYRCLLANLLGDAHVLRSMSTHLLDVVSLLLHDGGGLTSVSSDLIGGLLANSFCHVCTSDVSDPLSHLKEWAKKVSECLRHHPEQEMMFSKMVAELGGVETGASELLRVLFAF